MFSELPLFSSIQLNIYLLTCGLNSTSVNYKASTKPQLQQKTVKIHKNGTLNRQNKGCITNRKTAISIIEILGQKLQTLGNIVDLIR